MEHKDRRRKFKRHPLRWKTAVVFDKAAGKSIVHTHTNDLSVGGAAIVCDYEDLIGTEVTVLLAQPVRQSGEPAKMLKIRAQVVSSQHSPSAKGFRHGLKFVPSKGDGWDALAGILGAADAVTATATATPPEAEVEEFPAPPGSLLAQLKAAAKAKLLEDQQGPEAKAQAVPAVSVAVEKTYRYLKDLSARLNSTRPFYSSEYAITGVPKFDGLKWAEVQADFRTKEVSPTSKVFEQVTFTYHLSANKTLNVVREVPADQKLQQVLDDAKIEYSTTQERNDRGAAVGTKFVIPCEVRAALHLVGNLETGKLLLKMRNVEHFGTTEHVLAPEAVSGKSLEELARFILGESRRIGSLLLKGA